MDGIDFKPLLRTLAAQPDLTTTTPGPKCPKCGNAFIVTYGRRSKAWLVFHSGSGSARNCPDYRDCHPKSETQDEALKLAEQLAHPASATETTSSVL